MFKYCCESLHSNLISQKKLLICPYFSEQVNMLLAAVIWPQTVIKATSTSYKRTLILDIFLLAWFFISRQIYQKSITSIKSEQSYRNISVITQVLKPYLTAGFLVSFYECINYEQLYIYTCISEPDISLLNTYAAVEQWNTFLLFQIIHWHHVSYCWS